MFQTQYRRLPYHKYLEEHIQPILKSLNVTSACFAYNSIKFIFTNMKDLRDKQQNSGVVGRYGANWELFFSVKPNNTLKTDYPNSLATKKRIIYIHPYVSTL